MGFSSPAQEFVKSRLDLNKLSASHPDNLIHIETPTGFVLVNRSLIPSPGDTVAYQREDYTQLGNCSGPGLLLRTERGST